METQDSIDIVKLKRVALGQVSSAMIDPSSALLFLVVGLLTPPLFLFFYNTGFPVPASLK